MNTSLKRFVIAAFVSVPTAALVLLPASAQPGSDKGTPPAHQGPGGEGRGGEGRGGEGRGGEGRAPRSKWAEEYRQELREHPRLARALVSLHEAKDYVEKAPNEFGGHKASAIKAAEDAIKEIKEAMKFDATREGGDDEGRPGRDGKGGGKGGGPGRGGDGKPAGEPPAPKN